MAGIKLSPFGGMFPKVGTRLLPENSAQVATNLKLQSGEIRPLRKPGIINQPNKTLPALSINLARYREQSAWLSWPFDVDVARVPLSSEVESRFVWTGDGIPRIGIYSELVDGGSNDYPKISYALGIAPPITKATVTPDASGSGAATTRIYTYTFFSSIGEESASAPVSDLVTGKVDDVWAISGMDAFPTNTGDITDITFSGTSVTITTTNTHFNRVGETIVIDDVTTLTNVEGEWTLTATDPVAKTMTFNVDTEPVGTFDDLVDTAASWERGVHFRLNGMKRRLYRSTGLTGTVQLVDDDVDVTYNDSLTDAQILGDELISADWSQPPVGLLGVKVHSSGSLIGFVGNILCFSEPLQPHAWPEKYRLSTDQDIVALGIFGSDIGIGTTGNLWVASGLEPISMSLDKVEGLYPCLSKRSMTSFADGLIYASSHGLVYVSRSGVRVFTEQFYTRDEWRKLVPSSFICATAYGRLYAAYEQENSTKKVLVFDGDLLTSMDVDLSALYTDEATNELYICDDVAIKYWDSPTSFPLSFSWRSKDFVFQTPLNLGAAKIEFDPAISNDDRELILAAIESAIDANETLIASGNLNGSINSFAFNVTEINGSDLQQIPDNPPSNRIKFILRKNYTEIVIERTVTTNLAFRLPAGYKADVFSFELIGEGRVREVRISETMDGLRQL